MPLFEPSACGWWCWARQLSPQTGKNPDWSCPLKCIEPLQIPLFFSKEPATSTGSSSEREWLSLFHCRTLPIEDQSGRPSAVQACRICNTVTSWFTHKPLCKTNCYVSSTWNMRHNWVMTYVTYHTPESSAQKGIRTQYVCTQTTSNCLSQPYSQVDDNGGEGLLVSELIKVCYSLEVLRWWHTSSLTNQLN